MASAEMPTPKYHGMIDRETSVGSEDAVAICWVTRGSGHVRDRPRQDDDVVIVVALSVHD